jgi:hypothetical protein
MRGRDARKLLVPHFDLPIMVALERTINSLRAWTRPDGSVVAVILPTMELREILVRNKWIPRKWNSACVWWDEKWPTLTSAYAGISMGVLASRPSSFVAKGQMYHSTDTGETFIFAAYTGRGAWMSVRLEA